MVLPAIFRVARSTDSSELVMSATAIPRCRPDSMNRSPRPENRRTAGLRALRSESKWRDGGRGQRQRASARLRRLSHLQFAHSDALCSMGTSTFLVALPRPKESGCPAPVPFLSRATNAIGKPNVRPSSNFRVAKFPDSAELVAPGGIQREDRPGSAANFRPLFSTYKAANLIHFQALKREASIIYARSKSLIFL
jgi:hypothetical protein